MTDFDIRRLDTGDVDAVDRLRKANSTTLGFLPREALLAHLKRGWVLGAKCGDRSLAAYILFANRRTDVRVAHVCVCRELRGKGLARKLMERLATDSRNQGLLALELHCRRDFDANAMWGNLGFIPWGEKPGRARSGTILTLWRRELSQSDQMKLVFDGAGHGEIDVVMDAQVLFDLETPDDDAPAAPSKALLSDFLADELSLKITDETLVEIDRDDDDERRNRSRQAALRLPQVSYDDQSFRQIKSALDKVLPTTSDNDLSDIQQLAKAAASDATYFATRDKKLLRRSKVIDGLTGLQVRPPARIIVEIYDRMAGVRETERISGPDVNWRPLSTSELQSFESPMFLREGERKHHFEQKLDVHLSNPQSSMCDVLRFTGATVAVRVLSVDEGKVLNVHLARVTHRAHDRLIEPYFVMALVLKAVRTGAKVIVIDGDEVSNRLARHYRDFGFVEHGGSLVRFCIPGVLRREEVLRRMESLRSGSSSVFVSMEAGELERRCSPLCLADFDPSFLIVPIRPGYAVNIVDFMQSAGELFGGDPSRLLRPDNVYYRSAGTFKNLKPPARILWYVSGDRVIVGSSHLDGIEIGPAKDIFKKYQKRGTLDRRAVVEIAKGDREGEVVAISFSDTHPFPTRISLDEVKKVYSDFGNGTQFSPISMRAVSAEIFHELFKRGHGDTSSP
ncbi:MAG: GNAT family N-acetyltransferase [Gammaproteobacteria bacterium]|nr:GNAT family N-acetyltransferase [Gammaproteobacteria bacterium]